MMPAPARTAGWMSAGRRLALGLALVAMASMPRATAADTVALSIDASRPGAKIDRNIFGQFAEHLGTGIYEGVWVGPDSPIPNTRGIRRPATLNPNWGGVIEPNTFGTHEFMDFVDQIGSEAYLSVNLGSGTPQEAAEWLEYLTADQPTALAKERAANGASARPASTA